MKDGYRKEKGKEKENISSSQSSDDGRHSSDSASNVSSDRTSEPNERESSEQANRVTSILRKFSDLITPGNILSILIFVLFEATGLFMRASHPILTVLLNSGGLATYLEVNRRQGNRHVEHLRHQEEDVLKHQRTRLPDLQDPNSFMRWSIMLCHVLTFLYFSIGILVGFFGNGTQSSIFSFENILLFVILTIVGSMSLTNRLMMGHKLKLPNREARNEIEIRAGREPELSLQLKESYGNKINKLRNRIEGLVNRAPFSLRSEINLTIQDLEQLGARIPIIISTIKHEEAIIKFKEVDQKMAAIKRKIENYQSIIQTTQREITFGSKEKLRLEPGLSGSNHFSTFADRTNGLTALRSEQSELLSRQSPDRMNEDIDNEHVASSKGGM